MATALVETCVSEDRHSSEIEVEDEASYKRSCFNLSNVEPCVNKAIAHLDNLKKRLSSAKPAQTVSVVLSESDTPAQRKEQLSAQQYSRNATPKSILRGGDPGSSRSSRLIIEGVATGIPTEKETHTKKQVS